jgi:hypothetical protein
MVRPSKRKEKSQPGFGKDVIVTGCCDSEPGTLSPGQIWLDFTLWESFSKSKQARHRRGTNLSVAGPEIRGIS